MSNTKSQTVSPLRAFRLSIGIGADKAAEQVGVHKATYCRMEAGGDRMPTKANLARLLAFLAKHEANLTTEQLLYPELFQVKRKY